MKHPNNRAGRASARLAAHGGAKQAAPGPGGAKPSAYRKADDPDPYVGVGRNDPCPCGSGKKFKNCHGKNPRETKTSQIDDELLKELGIDDLTGSEREDFKDFIRNTLHERVGARLTEGMPDEKLDEFGCFMDGDVPAMKRWLSANVPDYEKDENFKQYRQSNPDISEEDLLSNYGSLMWLQLLRPDYSEVVRQTMEELKAEIKADSQAIIELSVRHSHSGS